MGLGLLFYLLFGVRVGALGVLDVRVLKGFRKFYCVKWVLLDFIGIIWGPYRDNGKYNGNCYLGLRVRSLGRRI